MQLVLECEGLQGYQGLFWRLGNSYSAGEASEVSESLVAEGVECIGQSILHLGLPFDYKTSNFSCLQVFHVGLYCGF